MGRTIQSDYQLTLNNMEETTTLEIESEVAGTPMPEEMEITSSEVTE